MTRPHDTSRDDCVDSVPDEAKGWLAGARGESQRLTQMTAILRLTQEDSRVDRSRLVLTTALEVILCLAAIVASNGQGLPPYPPTRADQVIERLHGVTVRDPYRWLERLDDPSVKEWVESQTKYSDRFFERLTTRQAIGRRLNDLWRNARVTTPWREAGQLFFLRNDGLQQQSVLYGVGDGAPEPHVVFDPNAVWPDGSIAVRDYVVSPDGRLLAYATAEGGADAGIEHLRDVSTGRELDDHLESVSNDVCWTRDTRGFFYFQLVAPDRTAGSAGWQRHFRYHVVGQPQSADYVILRMDPRYRWGYCMTSEDGRWAIAVGERGARSDMFVMRLDRDELTASNASPVQLLTGNEAMSTPIDFAGDTLYVHTDLGAPRQRVIALDLTKGKAARPRSVVPEGPHVIESAVMANGRIVVEYLVDASSRLRLFERDGTAAGEIRLPGLGAIGGLSGRTSSPDLFYAFRSFLTSTTIYRLDVDHGVTSAFLPVDTVFAASAFETRQIFYSSRDGTRVPMFITSRRDLVRNGTNPVLLTGYGGYGSSITPSYSPDLPLWLEAGGVYAVANLRGGGEYGEAWHRNGMLDKKQNSFDDFFAAAQYLIAERYTSAAHLAIFGESNGGLLVGAAITQRPDLFAAAVSKAGHHDMLRYHRFTAGAAWTVEYGSPEDPHALRYLLRYSPLHNVHAGTCYPGTLLLVADHDDRVVPSHSYKFGAALQAAQRCDQPVMLRVARGASHSYASTAERISEATDMWAFIADRLGVVLPSPVQSASGASFARDAVPRIRSAPHDR